MDLESPHPGYPFEGDYPGVYETVPKERQGIRDRQAKDLAGRHADPRRRRAILERLQALRERTQHPRVEFVCRDDHPDVQFAADEIVTSVTAYLDSAIRQDLERRGFVLPRRFSGPVPPQVIRLTSTRKWKPEDLLDVLLFLRAQGHPASLNYVLSQAQDDGNGNGNGNGDAPVGKAQGDPVPAPGLPPFPTYAAGFPPAAHPAVVHVIDGGIPAHVRSDHWLQSVARTGSNIDPLDVAPADGALDTMAGHGTRVAGIVQQVAPYAEIRMSRVADTLGSALDTDVAAAMLQAADSGAQVINVSLAGAILPALPPVATGAAVAQIRQRYGDRVAIVAAAGNFATTDYTYPASHPGVVSVGGLTAQLTPTSWSTRGWITFSTVAEWVRSTYVSSEYLGNPRAPMKSEPWAASTGTSFAAPQIAGAIARSCYERGLTPGAAVAELKRVGLLIPDFGLALQVLPGMP